MKFLTVTISGGICRFCACQALKHQTVLRFYYKCYLYIYVCGLLLLDGSMVLLYFIVHEQTHLSLSVIFIICEATVTSGPMGVPYVSLFTLIELNV